jgi:hypothetical protein
MADELENDVDFDTEVEVETEAPEAETESDSGDDQFQRADAATQKRINRLTKKMREAERQREEALRYAQQVQGEAQTLKSRLNNLDTSYVQEYTTRVSTQLAQAEAELSRAIEMGDSKGRGRSAAQADGFGHSSGSRRAGQTAAASVLAAAGRRSTVSVSPADACAATPPP